MPQKREKLKFHLPLQESTKVQLSPAHFELPLQLVGASPGAVGAAKET